MPDLITLSYSVLVWVLSALDRKVQMIMLLLLLVSLAVFAGPAGGTDVVVTKSERADVPPSWPKDAGEVVNDAS